ncbi:MAG TPA: hypothetical protein VM266_04270 [Solirubrobacteraceae bacterium]|nr:hypothetical protein [Solirubrobacteraceae bacterium]
MSAPPVTVAVTDHAVERFRQRVSGGAGALDVRPQIVARVQRAWARGRVSEQPPDGAAGQRGSAYVADLERRDLVYVCRWDRPRGELLVVTLWESGEAPAVPRRFTDELRRMERRGGLRGGRAAD